MKKLTKKTFGVLYYKFEEAKYNWKSPKYRFKDKDLLIAELEEFSKSMEFDVTGCCKESYFRRRDHKYLKDNLEPLSLDRLENLDKKPNSLETILCKELFFSSYNGKLIYEFYYEDYEVVFINYEMPVLERTGCAVDLVGLSKTNNKNEFNLLLIELKTEESKEPVIRPSTEITAYRKGIDNDKGRDIKKDFKKYLKKIYKGYKHDVLNEINALDDLILNIKDIVVMSKDILEDDEDSSLVREYFNNIEYHTISGTKPEFKDKYNADDKVFEKNKIIITKY